MLSYAYKVFCYFQKACLNHLRLDTRTLQIFQKFQKRQSVVATNSEILFFWGKIIFSLEQQRRAKYFLIQIDFFVKIS